MTDMKKVEKLETLKAAMEHIQDLREKREEIVYMFQDGGPVIWTSSKAQDNQAE